MLDIQYLQYYTRYVDDTLIIYDNSKVTHEHITHQFNQIHKDIKFNKITVNFLDLQIMRDTHNLHINIYRKPTTTDTTIHYTSNHPQEHKTAAYRYYLSRLHSPPLSTDHEHTEQQIIQTIAETNGFPMKHINRMNQHIPHNKNKSNNITTTSHSWKIRTTFTYFSPTIPTITNLFKHTNLQITYKTTVTTIHPTPTQNRT